MSQLSLTEGNVRRALSRFAIPFLGASLLQFLYGAVDLIVVGQFADQAGIAAVSTGSQVMQAVTNFIIGLSTGGTVLVGQYLGARRGEDVNRAIGTLFSLFALIAVVLAAAFALSTNAIVALMQVPAAAARPPGSTCLSAPAAWCSSPATIWSAACSGAWGTPSGPCTSCWWPASSTSWGIFCWWECSAWGRRGPPLPPWLPRG